MKMTIYRAMNAVNGKVASAILTAIMVTQPTQAIAQAKPTEVKAESVAVAVAVATELTKEAEPVIVEEPKAPETAQEILLAVCEAKGYGESCAKALLGMMWKESNNIANAVGDRGKALGYFQIHYKMHKVSVECATDLKCSAEWSLKYLERNKYPKYVSYAVQCHNGCNANNGYAASALRHGDRLWNKPLAITTVTQLAAK